MTTLFLHSCPRCSGAVECRGDELSCLSCGWAHYGWAHYGEIQRVIREARPTDKSPEAVEARTWRAHWLAKFNLTHREIARKLGVDESTVQKYLRA